MQSKKANANVPKDSRLTLQVMNDLTVRVIPNKEYEFLMTTSEVAQGYGVSKYAVRMNMLRNKEEILEGTHFIKGVTICNTLPNAQPHAVYWTKRGVIRLGFAMRSQRAKLFRDWAENLIIKLDEQADLFNTNAVKVEVKNPALPAPRRHNRLTQERLLGIMVDVARIEDKEIRLSIINKLGL